MSAPPVLFASLQTRIDDAITAIGGYFLLAATTIHLTGSTVEFATMWPADALILAMLLRRDRDHWISILVAGWIGSVLANLLTRDWAPGLILYGASNMAETWLAAWLLTREGRVGDLLADVPTVKRFVLYAGLVAPAVGALPGSLAGWLNYGAPFGPSFGRWFLSAALGYVIVTPFAMAVLNRSYARIYTEKTPGERVLAIGLHLANLAVALLVFGQNVMPMLFLPAASVLVLAFRLGRLGAILGVMVVAVVGTGATYLGHGPVSLVTASVAIQELYLQCYLVVTMAMTLPVAAAVASRADAFRRLAEREEALRLMMTNSSDGVLSFDRRGICRWAEGPLKAYLGVAPDAMVGRSLDALSLHAADAAAQLLAAREGEARAPVIEFSPLLRPDLTLEASIGLSRRDGQAVGTVVTLRDVTQRRAREMAILPEVQIDALTGLANRAGFRRHSNISRSDTGQATLALVDVDHFRGINDAHGHAIGDAVLVEIGRRLKNATRQDDLVARIGADEFAILLRCDLETARKVCERMVEDVRMAPVYGKGPISVLAAVSCGIAEYGSGLSRDEVFDAAEAALQAAKRGGLKRVRAA